MTSEIHTELLHNHTNEQSTQSYRVHLGDTRNTYFCSDGTNFNH